MKGKNTFYLLGLVSLFALSGCVVRTYQVTRERVDQEVTGNQGYLMGKAPAGEMKEKKPTRTTQVVEVEMRSPLRFEKMKQTAPAQATTMEPAATTEGTATEGNRGYISESAAPEAAQPAMSMEKYTVQKGDTLQKISQKFYGTTKRWNKIFQANEGVLKAPNKIFPGQVINVPVEGSKGPVGNLK